MQYQVPQFIQTEDKIIGGVFTLKQFIIVATGAAFSFTFFFIFNTGAWIFLTILVAAAVLAIAFIKIGGRPIPVVALAAFNYFWRPRSYLWRVVKKEKIIIPETKTVIHAVPTHEFKFLRKTHEGFGPQPATSVIKSAPGYTTEKELAAAQAEEIAPPKLAVAFQEKESAESEMKKAAAVPASLAGKTEPAAKIEASAQEIKNEEKISLTVRPLKITGVEVQKDVAPAVEPEKQPSPPALAQSNPAKVKQHNFGLEHISDEFRAIREKLSSKKSIENLFEKITTTKISLPKREKTFAAGGNMDDKFEVLLKATGEQVRARRVDYR